MKRRLFALFLAAALLLLVLVPVRGRAALEGVYFTAANESVLPLEADTMPFYSGGTLYVPSRLFDGTDLGVLYVRNDIMGLAILYTNKIDLRFDLESQIVYDKQGKLYTGYHAIEQNGVVFLPLQLVCRYFGLTWSYNETETAPLIRVKSSSVILDDRRFIDAAATQMRDYYADYERSLAAVEPDLPPVPSQEDPPLAAEGQKVYLIIDSQSPEETLELRVRRDHVPYDVWERQGKLMTTEGNVVHYGFIEKYIERLGERFNIREIAFDRWGAVQMVQNLEGMGFTVVPFGQGFKDMSPPTKELMKLVLEQMIAHGGHPVLRWMMDNIFIRTDPAGNIKADKEKSTEKIDGAVATIMGLDRAVRCGNQTSESVYDSRGLLVF